MLLVLNASPYHMEKQASRYQAIRDRIAETGMPVVYCNLLGGQDELVFDGASFVMNSSGVLTHQLSEFQEAMGLVQFENFEPVAGEIAKPIAFVQRPPCT